MRVLIIGGTKFIGPWVVRHLVDAGHRVAVFHRGQTTGDLPAAVLRFTGDRRRLAEFVAEFRQFSPDVAVDMIPYFERDAVTLMQTLRGIAGRVVAISSMDVYQAYGRFHGLEAGPSQVHPADENAPLRGKLYPYRAKAKTPEDWGYQYDKILVEQVVMGDPALPGTVLRLPAVYGPGDPQHRWFDYLKRMDDRRPVILLEEGKAAWRWTRGYVENVAAAIALAVVNPCVEGRIYNVGEPVALPEREWIECLGRLAGWPGAVQSIPRASLPPHLTEPHDWTHHLEADTRRIRGELGFRESVSLEEGLRRTLVWERAHPPPAFDPVNFDYAAEDAALIKAAIR
jgi:nucleoside-diphosphate-sugar epimerase